MMFMLSVMPEYYTFATGVGVNGAVEPESY